MALIFCVREQSKNGNGSFLKLQIPGRRDPRLYLTGLSCWWDQLKQELHGDGVALRLGCLVAQKLTGGHHFVMLQAHQWVLDFFLFVVHGQHRLSLQGVLIVREWLHPYS